MFKNFTSKIASLNVRSWGGKIATSVLMMVAMAMFAQSAQAKITEVMGSYTSTKGEAWSHEADIDWNTQKLVIAISDIASRGTENSKIEVLSFCGSNHDLGWCAYAVTFYNQGNNQFAGYSFKTASNDLWNTGNFNMASGTQVVEVSKAEGVKVNGTVKFTTSQLQDLLSCSRIKIGCTNAAQKCTYDYIRVVSTNTSAASITNIVSSKSEGRTTTYHQDGGWNETFNIDWDTQKLEVSVNSIGSNYNNAQTFCVSGGSYDLGWGKGFMCYNQTSTSFKAYTFANDGGNANGTIDITKGNLPAVFEISKTGGLKYNGNATALNSTKMECVTNFDQIKVGVNGTWSDAATFNYIRVVEIATGNVIKESRVNSLTAQNNVNVRLQRTLSSEYWNTFCVPFNIDPITIAQVFGEGTQIRTYGSMEGTTMNFVAATSIEAGKPYLIKPGNESVENPTFEGVDIVAGDPQAVGKDGYQMVGTYGLHTLTTDGTNLFLGAEDKFYKPETEATATMKGMRAYFVVPQGTSTTSLVANIDGVLNSIDQIDGGAKVVENPNAPVYNLNGQRVGNSLQGLSRGIYVQNGKKYVVK